MWDSLESMLDKPGIYVHPVAGSVAAMLAAPFLLHVLHRRPFFIGDLIEFRGDTTAVEGFAAGQHFRRQTDLHLASGGTVQRALLGLARPRFQSLIP